MLSVGVGYEMTLAERKRSDKPSGVSSSTTNPVGTITACHTGFKTNARRAPNVCNKLAGNFIRGCNMFKSNCKIDYLTPADVSDTSNSNPHKLLNTKHLLQITHRQETWKIYHQRFN